MHILVTGGAGYIGSHAAKRLLRDGHRVTILDDLSRGNAGAVDAIRTLPGASDRLAFVRERVGDTGVVEPLLRDSRFDAVMHFAAFAYIAESVQKPAEYHENNTAESLRLLKACAKADIERFVFSSTCATYGEPAPDEIPIRETTPQRPINPYGWSKLAVERALLDLLEARRRDGRAFSFAALRYFNVAGADADGLLGEAHDPETHLIPICLQAAAGLREGVTISGDDWPTPDGSCVRDFIHVDDLVEGHILALRALDPGAHRPLLYNLGLGRGISVREIIDSCRRVTGVKFPVDVGPRRPGDPPTLYADASKITRDLGWAPVWTDLDEIVASAWRWMRENPRGYRGRP